MTVPSHTPAPSRRARAPEFVSTAKALVLRRRTLEAINLLRRGLNLDPSCYEAGLLLARCLIINEKLDEARVTLDKLIMRKETLDAYVMLLKVQLTQQDWFAVLDTAEKSLHRYPGEKQIHDLLDRAQENLLDDCTEREEDIVTRRNIESPERNTDVDVLEELDPEDLPTTKMPEKSSPIQISNMIDTIRVQVTELTRPPSEEELSTSPAYRRGADGALEDPLTERTPTPLPGDDLMFKRPDASSLVLAVKQFVEPDLVKKKRKKRKKKKPSLFEKLLGDGPPVHTPPRASRLLPARRPRVELKVLVPTSEVLEPTSGNEEVTRKSAVELIELVSEDPDEIGGPTPAENPRAKSRQASPRLSQRITQEVSDTPGPEAATHHTTPKPAEPLFDRDQLFDEETPQERPAGTSESSSTTPREANPAQEKRQTALLKPPSLKPVAGVIEKKRPTKPLRSVDNNESHMVQLKDPLGQNHKHRIDDSRIVLPVNGELVDIDTADVEPTMPSPHGPRVLVDRDIVDVVPRLIAVNDQPLSEIIDRQLAQESTSARAIRPRRGLSRWWPVWLTLALVTLGAGVILGLVVRQKNQVDHNLDQARALAGDHRHQNLRKALIQVQSAANLGGRKPAVVALAAAIQAELAHEFGEAKMARVQALVQEGQRLGTMSAESAADLAVASAYLQLSRRPLPDAIGFLMKSLQRQPGNVHLKLLYSEALSRNGEQELALKIVDALPADMPQVLRVKAMALWRSGNKDGAGRLLRMARAAGMDKHRADLLLCLILVDSKKETPSIRLILEGLSRESLVPTRYRAWTWLLLSTISQRQGDAVGAARELTRALAIQPRTDVEFLYRAGAQLLSLNRQNEARAFARRAIRISPRDHRIIRLQAELDLAMNQPAKAISRLNTLPSLDAPSRLLLASVYLYQRDLPRCRQMLLKLQGASSPEKHLLWARLHLSSGKPYQALRELRSLGQEYNRRPSVMVIHGLVALEVGDLSGASRWMKKTLAAEPQNAEAMWGLGRLARYRGDARAALEHLRKAVANNPQLKKALMDLGRLQMTLGKTPEARAMFDRVLSRDPNNLKALAGRARAAVEMGGKDSRAYIKALSSGGKEQLAARLTARLQMKQGRWKDASKALRRLRRKNPRSGELMSWLAECKLQLGDERGAGNLYHELSRSRVHGPGAYLQLSRLSLKFGNLAMALQRGLAASEGLNQGIFSASLKANIRVQLARCYREGDALGSALAELQDVLILDRDHHLANQELGLVYASLNKRQRAIQHLDRASATRKLSPLARRELARICQDLASPPKACKPSPEATRASLIK